MRRRRRDNGILLPENFTEMRNVLRFSRSTFCSWGVDMSWFCSPFAKNRLLEKIICKGTWCLNTSMLVSPHLKQFQCLHLNVRGFASCVLSPAWLPEWPHRLKQGVSVSVFVTSTSRKPEYPQQSLPPLRFGTDLIKPSSHARNIGGCHYVNASHVNNVCKSAFYHLRPIFRIRKYLSTQTRTEILIHAFVTSKLDHCNFLL